MKFMDGYSRSPNMTRRLMEAVRAALYAHPTERLGQIIQNAYPADENLLFNVHDEDLVVALEQYAEGGLGG